MLSYHVQAMHRVCIFSISELSLNFRAVLAKWHKVVQNGCRLRWMLITFYSNAIIKKHCTTCSPCFFSFFLKKINNAWEIGRLIQSKQAGNIRPCRLQRAKCNCSSSITGENTAQMDSEVSLQRLCHNTVFPVTNKRSLSALHYH